MQGHQQRERNSVLGRCFDSFIQLGTDRPLGDLPDACLLHLAGTLIATRKRNFQRGDHHLQLTDVLVVRQRHQSMGLTVGG